MKKTLLATLTVVLASSTFAQIKYVDEVLTADKIKVTKNVVYGDNYTVLTGTPTLTSKVSMAPDMASLPCLPTFMSHKMVQATDP